MNWIDATLCLGSRCDTSCEYFQHASYRTFVWKSDVACRRRSASYVWCI